MKKFKNKLVYLLGGFIALLFNKANVSSYEMRGDYGVYQDPVLTFSETTLQRPSIWEKILSIILSPIFLATIVILSITIGSVIFIMKRKNNGKNKK